MRAMEQRLARIHDPGTLAAELAVLLAEHYLPAADRPRRRGSLNMHAPRNASTSAGTRPPGPPARRPPRRPGVTIESSCSASYGRLWSPICREREPRICLSRSGTGRTVAEAVRLIPDAIRYAFRYHEADYARHLHQDVALTQQQGFELVRLRNF